jgi:hypothetical protein
VEFGKKEGKAMSEDAVTQEVGDASREEREERVFLVLVDKTEEMRLALYYASVRARHTGGRVALLAVHEPEEFQYFAGVERILREEAEGEVEDLLRGLSQEVRKFSGREALTYIRRGDCMEEILNLLNAEKAIKVIVLAAGANENSPGPIIRKLSEGFITRLSVAVTLVPGVLTREDIEFLA